MNSGLPLTRASKMPTSAAISTISKLVKHKVYGANLPSSARLNGRAFNKDLLRANT
ncbi:hypothetical protein D3C87_1935850 [compost metagenome]